MARPKQDEIPGIQGEGVSKIVINELDRLGDKFIDIRDQKAELASKLTKVEAQMAEIMAENQISKYHFSDQEVMLKTGKTHVKIRTVKTDGADGRESSD